MNQTHIERALCDVIQSIQKNSGLHCPILKKSTAPAGDVPDFDSKVWPAATTLLAEALGIEIPNEENIFVDQETKKPLTITKIALEVLKVSKGEGSSSGQVA